jgi:putative ABC transport system permease protein
VDFSWESFAVGAIISIGTSLLLALPQLIALSKLPVRALFQESRDGGIGIGKTTIWAQLPLFLLWWLLTVFQVRSFKIGSWAFLGFLSGAALTACVGFIFLRMVGASARNFSWHWRQAMLYVSRHPATSISAMLAMSLGAGLINMVPQLRITIASELLTPNTDRPSLFLFDIQDDQVEPIRDFLKKEQLSLDSISPLVRARLDAINGKSPSEVASKISGTRERDEEERFQNRAQNLSFRKDLSNSERITEGRHVSETWDGKSLASITLVDSFASRLGIKVGDELTFDVQNVAVTGVVNGLRKVRWASFQPNFFVMFQPGVLEDAPKFYLATISNLQNDAKNSLVSRLAAAFPNVSAVDLGSTIENVMKLVDQISVAMSLIAMLAVITAAAVLFAIASHQALIRQPDMRMYTMLGGSFLRLRQMALFESAMLSIMSAGVGLLLGVASTWTVSHYIFDTVWHFNGSLAAGTFFALVLLSMTVSAIATSSRLRN